MKLLLIAALMTFCVVVNAGTIAYYDMIPTVDTAAYASGDALGNQVALTSAGTPIRGIIRSVKVIDAAEQSKALRIHFFSQAITAQTDNAAIAISDADALNYLGTVSVNDGVYGSYPYEKTKGYMDIGGSTVASVDDLNIALTGAPRMQIEAYAAPDYVTATDLKIRIGVEQ